MIDYNTKVITLIGAPLSQSFAARMQNIAYKAMGVNFRYFYTEADDAHLKEILNGLRYMPSVAGCAITKPNKLEVLKYLDDIDPLCLKIGACNTIVRTQDNKLIGYNTDGMGFYMSIEQETNFALKGSICFCIGAGGAGRAICSSLAFKGAQKIFICDKNDRAAFNLVNDINNNFGNVAHYVNFMNFNNADECELLINASGVGMGTTQGQSPVPIRFIQPKHFCFDACYNPHKTQFLLDAEKKGCKVLNGLGMSLYQGVAQIKIWTGKDAPVEIMRSELVKITKENKFNGMLTTGKRK